MKNLLLTGIVAFSGSFQAAIAEDVSGALSQVESVNQQSARKQTEVNTKEQQLRDIVSDTRSLRAETLQTELYNRQLSAIIESQKKELASKAAQLSSIDDTERGILPLMQSMLDQLDADIRSGVPFQLDERLSRVTRLQALMPRSDISVSEKYRRISEALLIEVEYGRTIEAWRQQIDSSAYEMLRIGRIGLYRLALDYSHAEAWQSGQWVDVSSHAPELINAVRVARQNIAPQLITAPLILEDSQ